MDINGGSTEWMGEGRRGFVIIRLLDLPYSQFMTFDPALSLPG